MKVELELHTKEEIVAFNEFCQKLMSIREKAEEKKETLRGKIYQNWPLGDDVIRTLGYY